MSKIKTYLRCINIVERLIEGADDVGLDDIDTAALQTAIHAMEKQVAAIHSAKKRKIVAWTERDGDEWVVYGSDSDTGQHIAEYQKHRHFKEIFPIYDVVVPHCTEDSK